jgi:tetratricopeptide (TPR) repeat protein
MAINRYDEIIQAYPDRLEGFEALLKKGFCYAKLGNNPKAIEIFDSLIGTILEPYALAERGMMELPSNGEIEVYRKEGDYKQAYLSFKALADKFPGHQAVFRILYPCYLLKFVQGSNNILFKKNLEETLSYKIELFKIGLETLSPPSQSQIKCLGSMISHMIVIGSWSRAISCLKEYLDKHLVYVIKSSLSMVDILHVAYCCDLWDEFLDKYKIPMSDVYTTEICPILILDKMDPTTSLKIINDLKTSTSWKSTNYKIIIQLCLKQKFRFLETIDHYLTQNRAKSQILFALRDTEVLMFEMMLAADKNDNYLNELNTFLNEIKNYNFKATPFHEKKLVLFCFYSALGFELPIDKNEITTENSIYLAGPRLELAINFLKGELFELSDKWSKKPSTCYFDRLLYCFWLWEKNQLVELKLNLKNLINPKLGDAYFQPIFLNLEAKLKLKLKE